jgi:hypothetical protein
MGVKVTDADFSACRCCDGTCRRLLDTLLLPEQSVERITRWRCLLCRCALLRRFSKRRFEGAWLRRGDDARLQSPLGDFGRGLPAGITVGANDRQARDRAAAHRRSCAARPRARRRAFLESRISIVISERRKQSVRFAQVRFHTAWTLAQVGRGSSHNPRCPRPARTHHQLGFGSGGYTGTSGTKPCRFGISTFGRVFSSRTSVSLMMPFR